MIVVAHTHTHTLRYFNGCIQFLYLVYLWIISCFIAIKAVIVDVKIEDIRMCGWWYLNNPKWVFMQLNA
jgi:hypothetical protein